MTRNLNDRMISSVQVRLAELDDAKSITTVINAAFRRAEGFFIDTDRIDVECVLNCLDTGKFLLAENEGVLLGCVYVEPHPLHHGRPQTHQQDRAYLGLLAIDPEHQQSGLGSGLMDAAEDYCRGLSCRFMDIQVVNLREELPDFYRRRGYVETGTSPFPTDVETKLPCHFIDMSKPLRDE